MSENIGINQYEYSVSLKTDNNVMPIKTKTDFERTPQNDEIVIKRKTKKKRNVFTRVIMGMATAAILMYGAFVLKNKITKPTLEEVQKCFNELLKRDLSPEEFNTILDKYKEISKTKNSEEYVKQLVEQVKKDYGLEKVDTKLNIDSIYKTQKDGIFYSGTSTPFGDINVNIDELGMDILNNGRNQTFVTTFHELKHLQQYADAYRTDADKFTDILVSNAQKIRPDMFTIAVGKTIKQNEANGIKVDTKKALELVIEATKKSYRKELDKLYKDLPKYKKDSPEYQKGLDYMTNYSNYIEAHKDMKGYREQIMEKEAYENEKNADKIYRYLTSIWKVF